MNILSRITAALAGTAFFIMVIFWALACPIFNHGKNFDLFMPYAMGSLLVLVIIVALVGIYNVMRYVFTGKTPYSD